MPASRCRTTLEDAGSNDSSAPARVTCGPPFTFAWCARSELLRPRIIFTLCIVDVDMYFMCMIMCAPKVCAATAIASRVCRRTARRGASTLKEMAAPSAASLSVLDVYDIFIKACCSVLSQLSFGGFTEGSGGEVGYTTDESQSDHATRDTTHSQPSQCVVTECPASVTAVESPSPNSVARPLYYLLSSASGLALLSDSSSPRV